jgi:hypothetical protein
MGRTKSVADGEGGRLAHSPIPQNVINELPKKLRREGLYENTHHLIMNSNMATCQD